MTEETRRLLFSIQAALRTMAEQEPNDLLANSASALAVRLESVGTSFGMTLESLTDVDRQIIQHAMQYKAITA
jgi:hypothetical protein